MRSRRVLPVLACAALALPVFLIGPAATADHTAPPDRVTVMGSLMDELGCDAEWDEGCAATDMNAVPGGGWELVAEVPAGSYEWKVRLDGSWDESYGGGPDGTANVPLHLEHPAELRFGYDHTTHAVQVAPAAAAEPLGPADRALARESLRESLTRERFYFVMADRFDNGDPANDDAGLGQDRLVSGLDPTATGFYHGGDLDGILDRLDYIEGLGTTAIWLTPSFKNKPVQGAPGSESAGYHGYWITDFTRIDPHLGTNEDMRTLVDEAHDRGIKVFFDVITNHTADVIGYDRAAHDANGNLPYVDTEEQPYRDAAGVAFDDREYADGDPPFPPVDEDSFPYRPVVPAEERDVKVPSWLNDPTLYHNRGTSTFAGESNTYGDFPSGPYSALDDLWTEHPRVVDGMVDIYKTWVGDIGIDGFRIDTVKHVNTEFWQQFSPALTDYAASVGNDDFFMFGEIFDASSRFVSQYTTEGTLQAAADFGFQANASGFARGGDTSSLRDFFAEDDWYTDADSNAYQLPTFLGNHDMGRIGSMLRQSPGDEGDAELLARDELAHSLMYLTRGQPVVYYGDEQGFSAPPDVAGGIGDQRAREDMFPSRVDLYNGYDLIGTDATTAEANFDDSHPLYKHISKLAKLRRKHPALADGAQVHRLASDGPGAFAFSRVDVDTQREYVVAVNNSESAQQASFDTFTPSTTFKRVWSSHDRSTEQLVSGADGGVTVDVPALGTVVFAAKSPIPPDAASPEPTFSTPTAGGVVGDRAEVGVDVAGDGFVQTTFAWRPVGGDRWEVLGTDDNAPYRVFHDVRNLPTGALVEYRAVTKDADGELGVDQTHAVVGEPPTDGGDSWGGPVVQPTSVSVPGSFNSEVGCPEDWQPTCPAIDLALDQDDLVWSRTFADASAIPQGGYAFKAAVDDDVHPAEPWKENYGLGGVQDGPNIELTADGGPITFWYSHATHWVTNSVETPHRYVATGDFQSELGCASDDDAACLRSWLQDPDGDDVWTFRSHTLPAGSYRLRVAQDLSDAAGGWGEGGSPSGADLTFTLADGEGVEVSFTPPEPSDPSRPAPLLDVTTYPAPQ